MVIWRARKRRSSVIATIPLLNARLRQGPPDAAPPLCPGTINTELRPSASAQNSKAKTHFDAGICRRNIPSASFSTRRPLDIVSKRPRFEAKLHADASIANPGPFVSDHPFSYRHRRHPAGRGVFRHPAEAVRRQRAIARGTGADRKHQGHRARHRCPVQGRGGRRPGAARLGPARRRQSPGVREAAAPDRRGNRAGFFAGRRRRKTAHQHAAAGRPDSRTVRSRIVGRSVFREADRRLQRDRGPGHQAAAGGRGRSGDPQAAR